MMGSIGDEEKRSKRVIAGGAESLGWLTESTIMPKKHKAIQGVGASSIMELKAELYKSQEESKKSKDVSAGDADYHRAKKITPIDPFARKNSCVDSRAHLDKLALKAVSDGSASYAALEKKAELYEKLAKGELSDEEDKEKYCVDFSQKGFADDELKKQNNRFPAAEVYLLGKLMKMMILFRSIQSLRVWAAQLELLTWMNTVDLLGKFTKRRMKPEKRCRKSSSVGKNMQLLVEKD